MEDEGMRRREKLSRRGNRSLPSRRRTRQTTPYLEGSKTSPGWGKRPDQVPAHVYLQRRVASLPSSRPAPPFSSFRRPRPFLSYKETTGFLIRALHALTLSYVGEFPTRRADGRSPAQFVLARRSDE